MDKQQNALNFPGNQSVICKNYNFTAIFVFAKVC